MNKYLKRTFEKKSRKIGSIKCGLHMKYLLNTVQNTQYFAFKYLKWTIGEKSHQIGSIKYVAGVKYLLNKIQ